MPTAVKRGAVVEYPALFAFDSYPRPYLVVSGDAHPSYGEEYVGLAVTTTAWEAAVPVPDDGWVLGGLPKPSYVKPWQPTLLKHDDIEDAFGILDSSFVDRVVGALGRVVECERTDGSAPER